jgi:hypothetical protein
MRVRRARQWSAVELWPMRVTTVYATWPEMSRRQRMWVPAATASMLVDRRDLADLIHVLATRFRMALQAA